MRSLSSSWRSTSDTVGFDKPVAWTRRVAATGPSAAMIWKTAGRFIVLIRPGCPTGLLLRCPFVDPERVSLRVRSNAAESLLRIGRIIYQPVSVGPAFLQVSASIESLDSA